MRDTPQRQLHGLKPVYQIYWRCTDAVVEFNDVFFQKTHQKNLFDCICTLCVKKFIVIAFVICCGPDARPQVFIWQPRPQHRRKKKGWRKAQDPEVGGKIMI
jgi:hypothetical protein